MPPGGGRGTVVFEGQADAGLEIGQHAREERRQDTVADAGDMVLKSFNEGVEVRIEDNAIFVAEMGEVAGQVAVSLTKRI